jgi:FKBP-type peptidyl-prolyl cis-trans isomerase
MKVKYLVYLLIIAGTGFGLQGCLPDNDGGDKQLEAEVKLIDDYLEASGTSNVLYDNAHGIRFIVHHYGDGPPPAAGQIIQGTYDGRLFSSSGNFEQFKTGSVDDNVSDITPEGLAYIYSILLEGSAATVFLPSKYGYGKDGTTDVPPNATLVYTVSLNNVEMSSAQESQFEEDTLAIRAYADTLSSAPIKHPSGLWYATTVQGSGDQPTPYSVVTMKYKLRVLGDNGPGDIIEENTLTDTGVFGLINGLKIGIPLMREGSKTTFYIPSYLGYGTAKQGSIPANSNLIFEIELVSITQ